jgi:hypothetical protein
MERRVHQASEKAQCVPPLYNYISGATGASTKLFPGVYEDGMACSTLETEFRAVWSEPKRRDVM